MKGIVSLADARALAEAGITIETSFVWTSGNKTDPDRSIAEWYVDFLENADIHDQAMLPAPSVAELLDWLPEELDNCPLTLMPAKGIGYLDSWSPTYQAWLADVVGGTPEAALVELILWVAKEGKK